MTLGGESALSAAEIDNWLAAPRFRSYLAVTDSDPALALELYRWNSQAAAAALVDVGHLEVALRNGYDRVLIVKHPEWTIDRASTLFERVQGLRRSHGRQRELNSGSREAIAAAARGLGAEPSHGQMVAALPFGFWSQLTRAERAGAFWNPIIHRVFPPGTSRPQVHDLVQRVVKFRNRLVAQRAGLLQQHGPAGAAVRRL